MSGEEEPLSWRSKIVLLLGRGFLQILGRTWRIRVVNGDFVTGLRRTGRPFIFALWHGQLLPLLWHHREEGVLVLISEHRDGELVAQTAKSLGYGLIRGSTTRGAERALISLVRELQGGHEVAITPDGPRGPARTFAPGALVAAQRSLRSWDRFMIPKPFARITVAYGQPAKVLAKTSRAAPQESARFEELLNKAVEIARG
jgi:lysophospholipid acyltransferase (LPLAT)-like uncharacterized protein